MIKRFSFLIILLFIFCLNFNVYAKNITSVDFGTDNVNIGYLNGEQTYLRSFTNHAWAGWGSGLLYGSLSVSKLTGTSTDDTPKITFIKSISSNGQEYQCFFGATSYNNSTQTSTTISYFCPTSMGLNGLEGLVVGFTHQNTYDGTALLRLNGTMTFVQDDSVNIDTSGIISSNNSNTQAVRDIGNQISGNVNQVNDSVNNNTQAVNNVNNSINNSNVSSSTSSATDFFDNFSQNNHGLSGIITSPLRLVQSLTTSTCTPLSFQLPFVHNTVSLPCMQPIIRDNFNLFYVLFQLIVSGLLTYRIILNLLHKIRLLQNPNYTKIEVLNL